MRDLIDERNQRMRLARSIVKQRNVVYITQEELDRRRLEEERQKAREEQEELQQRQAEEVIRELEETVRREERRKQEEAGLSKEQEQAAVIEVSQDALEKILDEPAEAEIGVSDLAESEHMDMREAVIDSLV